ncbi:hypothetical protein K501DRAFT_323673 [Backusella circina FSU 941]|nr:hypothetical protein K501DRAFT_323673 [Backusella circina FSU 941]
MICNACNISEQHIFLGGITLGNLNSNDIKTILDECIQVEYNVDLVEEVYHNSCICQSTNIIPTSSKNNSNNDMNISLPNSNSKNDMNISPLVLSFYTERKEHLVVEIEQRKKALSRFLLFLVDVNQKVSHAVSHII